MVLWVAAPSFPSWQVFDHDIVMCGPLLDLGECTPAVIAVAQNRRVLLFPSRRVWLFRRATLSRPEGVTKTPSRVSLTG